MPEGVDYSFSRPNLDCLKANGVKFVVRYTSNGTSSKNITKAEADALRERGIQIVIVHQNGTNDMLQGRSKGVMDATSARMKTDLVGMPPDRPIYFALDQDPGPLSDTQINACKAYLDGCASVLGRHRVGLYAGYRGIELLCPTHAPWGWQTYAWSRGRISEKAHFRQYLNGVAMCGGEVDLNESYRPDFGQWPIAGATPPPRVDEIPQEYDDMLIFFTSDNDAKPAFFLNGGKVAGFKTNADRAAMIALGVKQVDLNERTYDEWVRRFR
jgi:hypothetical protein